MKKLILSLFAILFAINLYAQPSTITYQGVLTDAGGVVLNGNYTIRFDICTGVNGVNSVWNETHNPVSVTNGLFQVELGSQIAFSTVPLNFATPYWLEITVDPSGTPVVLSPRVKFNASNYSLAGKATSLQIASGAGVGKVLTSDASGNASWQAASGGSGLSSYGFVFQLSTIADATVVGGADVPFSNNGLLNGISHTAGTTTQTVLSTGVYKIDYNITITAGIGAQIALAVNGTADPSTPISLITATGQYSGSAILSLVAGDVITLRNNSAVPLTMTLAPAVSAQLNFIKLD